MKLKITDFFSLLGGLALFLHGMQMMSSGLEAAAGNRMKGILEKLTTNRFLGVLVGAVITAVIQSSSATTVMTVGFVNSGMMSLQQAVWVIMGANVGTTITGQLIALDIGAIAPLFAFCGVALIMFVKKKSVHHYGQIIAGLGILFIGMGMMSSSMTPLRNSEAFVQLMTKFSNPVLGILAGMIFTALIQSSSASVGILQALAASGLIGLKSAVFVLFGQNIGTCITAVLASIGTGKNAKRTTLIHLMFNMIGTILFTVLCILTPLTSLVESWTPGNTTAQIANMHTFFNIATTVLLLPLGTSLAKLATKILPDKGEETLEEQSLLYLQPLENTKDHQIGISAMALNGIVHELKRMKDMVGENLTLSFQAVEARDSQKLEAVEKTEDYIDYLNKEISKYISQAISRENNLEDANTISAYFKVAGNLERVGDHAVNICEYSKRMEELGLKFSEHARGELAQMREVSAQAVALLGNLEEITPKELTEIAKAEQYIDDLTVQFRQNQMERLHKGSCSDDACILYSEILTDFERIGDHILNIGEALVKA